MRVLSGVINVRVVVLILIALMVLVCCRNSQAQSTSQAIESVLPRVVKIFGAGGVAKLKSYSTGFLVSADGHIATVWSHVLDSDLVTVVLNDGRRFKAKVLGAEPQLDLAVLKIDQEDIEVPYFDLKKSGLAASGTRILGFSNMFNVAAGDEPVSVLHGVIAARTKLDARRGTYEIPFEGEVYIVDAITNNSGAAGGALTDRSGRLLGMIGKELKNAKSNTWVNYAVPIGNLTEPIEQIISGRFESKPTKELEDDPNRYKSLDFGLVMVPDVIARTPAFVDAVVTGSQAAEKGFKPDDLVLFVNDELVQSCRMLRKKLGALEAGDTLQIVVRRNDQLVTIEMPVPKKDEPQTDE